MRADTHTIEHAETFDLPDLRSDAMVLYSLYSEAPSSHMVAMSMCKLVSFACALLGSLLLQR